MRRDVRVWVDKAEGDYRVALRESRVRKEPSPDAMCFHAQQCVEKYFKAILVLHRQPVQRVHDLVVLWRLVAAHSSHLRKRIPGLGILSIGAVEYRYPGRRATRVAAQRAVTLMKNIRKLARLSLGLP
jgi:HEPN domain-containing protein